MKKTAISIISITVFLLVLYTAFSSPQHNALIENEVESFLTTDEYVSVIVELKDESIKQRGIQSLGKQQSLNKRDELESRKQMIKKQQDNVFSDLKIEKFKKTRTEEIAINSEGLVESITPNTPELKLKHQYSTVNSFSGEISTEGLEKLRNNPNVKSIKLNRQKSILLDVSVPQINATRTWSLSHNGTNMTGEGETVCVLDTGVDYTHTNLGGCSSPLASACAKVIGGYDFVNDDTDPMDDHGHGTHVAGIVASTNPTYKGVAPDAGIVAIKVCNSGGGCSDADMIAGIDWCTDNASKYNISVITMSIGDCTNHSTYCNDDNLAPVINTAVGQGLIVTISAGNGPTGSCVSSGITNTAGPASPACVQNATAIGSVTHSDTISYQRGALFELLAPGGGGSDYITSTQLGGGFTTMRGTSMAAPHAAGAFAILQQFNKLQKNANLTLQEARDALNNTGKRIDDSANSGYNFTRIDIFSAILSIDDVSPSINFTSPTPGNNSRINSSWVFVNVISNEVLHTAFLEINGTNHTMIGSALSWSYNKTGLLRETYSYTVYGNDSAGNIGMSETRIVYVNNTAPSAALDSPAANSYTSLNFSILNWTVIDEDNDTATCYIYADNTSSPLSIINTTNEIINGTTLSFNWTGLNDSTYYWYARCNDSTASSTSSASNFTVDLLAPKIDFAGGTESNNTFNGTSWVFVNVSITERNFNNITFAIYNASHSIVNATNYTSEIYSINFSDMPDGTYYYNSTTRDKVGRENSTHTRKIIIDSTPPATNASLKASDYDTDGNIEINWTDDAVELNNRNQTIKYRIFRSTSEITAGNIGSADLLSSAITNGTQFYEDNTTTHGTAYYYAIVTVDSFDRYNDSVFAAVSASATDSIYPRKSTGLNGTLTTCSSSTTNNQINLRWSSVSTDVLGNSEAGVRYVLYYLSSSNAVNTSPSDGNLNTTGYSVAYNNTDNSTTFCCTDCTSATTYHFFITTLDDGGNANLSVTTGAASSYFNTTLTYTSSAAPQDDGGSGGGGGGGGGGGSAGVSESQHFGTISSGGVSTRNYDKADQHSIDHISLYVSSTVSNVRVEVKKISKPENAEDPISESKGGVYRYLSIVKTNLRDEDISKALIKFRVSKTWIKENDYDSNSVSLVRYENTKWNKVITKKISEDNENIFYEAETPGFSIFAITAEKQVTVYKTAEFEKEEPAEKNESEITEEPEKEQAFTLDDIPSEAKISFIVIGIIIVIALIIFRTEAFLIMMAKRHSRKAIEHHKKARHYKIDYIRSRKHHIKSIIHHRHAIKNYLRLKNPEHVEKARHHDRAVKKHIQAIHHLDDKAHGMLDKIYEELEEIHKKL